MDCIPYLNRHFPEEEEILPVLVRWMGVRSVVLRIFSDSREKKPEETCLLCLSMMISRQIV